MNVLIQAAFPDRVIQWDEHNETPDLVIRGMDSGLFYESCRPCRCPYILWSGEPGPVPYYELENSCPPIAEINTFDVQRPVPSFFVSFMNFVAGFQNTSSNVPLLLHTSNVHTPDFHRAHFLAYAQRHCVPFRDQVFAAFKRRCPNTAHALGKCSFDNRFYKGDKSFNDNIQLFSTYRWVLAMENSDTSASYVSEKIFIALRAGVIPIYWGSRGRISTLFNQRRFVRVEDFPTIEALVDHVIAIDNNEQAYSAIVRQPIFPPDRDPPPELFIAHESVYTQTIGAAIRREFEKFLSNHPRHAIEENQLESASMRTPASSPAPGIHFAPDSSAAVVAEPISM